MQKSPKNKKNKPRNPVQEVQRDSSPLPSWKKFVFSLIALIGIPFFLLGCVEIALRLGGWGYPPAFFEAARVEGRPFLRENKKFGWRFFPRAMARTAEPILLSEKKEPGEFRIFTLGESAAQGDPAPAYSFSRILEIKLRREYPDVNFQMINTAMVAINSHVVREIARECATKQPDLFIVYLGNNEVVGPYGAGTVFRSFSPNLSFIRVGLFMKRFHITQVMEEWLSSQGKEQEQWMGMEMFLNHQVRLDEPALQSVFSHFRSNLQAICQSGIGAGAEVILCTVPTNLKDCAPFASQHKKNLSQEEQKNWEVLVEEGKLLSTQNKNLEAIGRYEQAKAIDHEYADLHFRLAHSYLEAGDLQQAELSFRLAQDYDTLRFRADSSINAVIREVADNADSRIRFVDAEQELCRASGQGIPGNEFFFEHVHLNFTGNDRVAGWIVSQVREVLGQRGEPVSGEGVASEEECRLALAFTPHDEFRLGQTVASRLGHAPFTGQSNHEQQLESLHNQIERCRQQIGQPGSVDSSLPVYREALLNKPDDYYLQRNFAYLLIKNGRYEAARPYAQSLAERYPNQEIGAMYLGMIAHGLGRSDEAILSLQKALEIQSKNYEIYQALGKIHLLNKEYAKAKKYLEDSLRLAPENYDAYNDLGVLSIQIKEVDSAIAYFNRTLAIDPHDANAHKNLGLLFSEREDYSQAALHFEQAVRSIPEDDELRKNLGLVYGHLQRYAAAGEELRWVIQRKPDDYEAHYHLATTFARQGAFAEAIREYLDCERIHPGNPEVYYFLCLANLKIHNHPEAERYCNKVLEILPTHPEARQILFQLQQMQ